MATTTKCCARLEGERIVIESPFSFESAGFFKSLPFARELRGRGWSCAPTEYAAYLLMDRGVACDDAVANLAADWVAPQHRQVNAIYEPIRTVMPCWDHQTRAHHFARPARATMLGLGMGCGKTKVTIDLLQNWGSQAVLILCPKAVVPVWPKELTKHHDGHYMVKELTGGTCADKRDTLAESLKWHRYDQHGALIVVVNYESAWRDPLGPFILGRRWDVVVLDESHKIKDAGGRSSKFCSHLGLRADRRLCLSGTPMPHSPLDIFGQYRFLDPAIFGTSYVEFRSRYAVTHPEYKTKVLRWVNQDDLAEKIGLLAIQITASEAGLSLPPVQHIERPVVLERKTRAFYDKLENEMVAELVDDGGKVICDNPLVKLLRLQQITCGFVATEDEYGERDIQNLSTEKSDALAELIDEAGDSPIVVFARFVHDLAEIERVTENAGKRYAELSGSRRELAPDATYPANVDVLGVQIQSGGAGIDLSKSSIAVFYSIGCISHGDFEQACARLNRPGQANPVRFYHMIGSRTVDESAYKAIRDGKEIVDAVLESMKRGNHE